MRIEHNVQTIINGSHLLTLVGQVYLVYDLFPDLTVFTLAPTAIRPIRSVIRACARAARLHYPSSLVVLV